MKFPNNIILDVNNKNIKFSSNYWIASYITFFQINNYNFETINVYYYKFFKIKFLKNKKFKKLNIANKKKNLIKFIRFFYKFKNKQNSYVLNSSSNFKNFDINFLKKEKIYTKLKYSRVPQYDIVSGGVAAIFAGFLGFLICEKFGFELLDSGDFYFIFMYIVFFSFLFRLFFKILNFENTEWYFFSFKWFFLYLEVLFNLIKFFFKKI